MKKEKPTTIELAQLAAQLHPKVGAERESIKQALSLWTEAERELKQMENRAEHLRDLVAVIYTAAPEEWQARLDNYPGDRSDVDNELLKRVPADKVHQALFKDKSLSKQTRKTLFVGLLKYAEKRNMARPPHRTSREVESYLENADLSDGVQIDLRDGLDGDELMLRVVRWAVEVRQRQVAESHKRFVPQSSSGKQARNSDSIQFKPKYSA